MAASRSTRTPLMAMLRKCYRQAGWSDRETDLSREILRSGSPWKLDRRGFVRGALILGAGTLLPGCRKAEGKGGAAASETGPSAPKVAIVGAGIAGLAAAHRLSQEGVRADIYEASTRPGGRIMTLRDVVAPGLYTEAGGEFIDSGHKDMLRLAAGLGLAVSDMRGEAYGGFQATAWRFGGSLRSEAEMLAEVKRASGRLREDIDALPDEIAAGTGGFAAGIDRLSLEDYLRDRGVTGWFGDLLKVAYVTEFGLDAGEQSALNLLTMISLDASGGEFAVYGESDERFRVEGGNQRVTDGLARLLEPQLRYGHRLEAVAGGSGGFALSFQGPGGAVEKRADTVILALPVPLLRKVDIRMALPETKRRSIQELGMGTNSKLFLGFSSRPWRRRGYLGYFHSDGPLQSGWDHTQTQDGGPGGLTVFQGGKAGVDLGGASPSAQADRFAGDLEALFPGSRKARNGRTGGFHWPASPLALGSYSCYKVGQWTSIGGEEGKSVGDLHFAGEHCSAEFQGYMNGGAESGRVAAEAVIAKWKGTAAGGATTGRS